jgi:hypothetical protein
MPYAGPPEVEQLSLFRTGQEASPAEPPLA